MPKRKIGILVLLMAGIAFLAGGGFFSYWRYKDAVKLGNEKEHLLSSVASLDQHTKLPADKVKTFRDITARYSRITDIRSLELILANDLYRAADARFWDFIQAELRPGPKNRPDLEKNLALYDGYIQTLNNFLVKKDVQYAAMWQAWNNRATAKVYQIFLGFLLKKSEKDLQKLAKEALADYVHAMDLCEANIECTTFVGQNIDWLTRMPPQRKRGEGDKSGSPEQGGGLGQLFNSKAGESEMDSGAEAEGGSDRVPLFIPGASPGHSVKGAH